MDQILIIFIKLTLNAFCAYFSMPLVPWSHLPLKNHQSWTTSPFILLSRVHRTTRTANRPNRLNSWEWSVSWALFRTVNRSNSSFWANRPNSSFERTTRTCSRTPNSLNTKIFENLRTGRTSTVQTLVDPVGKKMIATKFDDEKFFAKYAWFATCYKCKQKYIHFVSSSSLPVQNCFWKLKMVFISLCNELKLNDCKKTSFPPYKEFYFKYWSASQVGDLSLMTSTTKIGKDSLWI